MAKTTKPNKTLLVFHAHLEVLKAEMFGLLSAALKAQREQQDDWGRRQQHFDRFLAAYDAAIELLNGELRSVIPESAVEATTKAWCVNATRILEKVRRWVQRIGVVHLNQTVWPWRWEATRRNHFGSVPLFEVPSDADKQTEKLQDELLGLAADVHRFLSTAKPKRKILKTVRATVLVEQAVRKYHKFEGGIVDKTIPPISGRELAKQSDNAFSARSADRWFVERFGSKEAYQMACINGTLGQKLTVKADDARRAFGTFDHSEHEVSDDQDDDNDGEHESAQAKRGKRKPRIKQRF